MICTEYNIVTYLITAVNIERSNSDYTSYVYNNTLFIRVSTFVHNLKHL